MLIAYLLSPTSQIATIVVVKAADNLSVELVEPVTQVLFNITNLERMTLLTLAESVGEMFSLIPGDSTALMFSHFASSPRRLHGRPRG